MKKISTILFFTIFLMMAIPSSSFANNGNQPKQELTQEMIDAKVQRIEEIHQMDLKSLSRSEKKALKKEVRAIEKDLAVAADKGGLYLSTTAIIIILLIIIIL